MVTDVFLLGIFLALVIIGRMFSVAHRQAQKTREATNDRLASLIYIEGEKATERIERGKGRALLHERLKARLDRKA